MAFGDRFKKFAGKIAPFGARNILGADKEDKEKLRPQAQFYGGDEEQSRIYRNEFKEGARAGSTQAQAGIDRTNSAANYAQQSLADRGTEASNLGADAQRKSAEAGGGFDRSIGDYRGGRDATLGNAAKLEASADNMAQEYQQTSDKAFALNQDRNQRSALSMAAGRGAAGLRTALATSSQANADAANQAEITRANEANQLIGMRNDARVNAAGIRSGVGTQDQNAANAYSGRQQTFDANALNANNQAGQFDVAGANVQQNAGALETNAGITSRGQYLGATQGMEGDQLSANQKNEDQRQVDERNRYNDKWMVMSKFNAK